MAKTQLQFLLMSVYILVTQTAKGHLQDNYIGCYYDDVNDQPQPEKTTLQNNTTLTIEWCIEQCLLRNSTYAGLKNSKACLCGEDFGVSLPDAFCNSLCPGNQAEYCGGSKGQRAFYSIYVVCEIGYYGRMCDQVCRCKGQAPCNRVTGICPNECEEKWYGTTCSDILLSEKYIGCFRDNETRAISQDYTCGYPGTTAEWCSNNCNLRGNSIVGLQAGFCCFCGESYARYGPLSEDSCSDNCVGNPSQKCGGGWANSVYSVCPAGYYGPNCHNHCHCYNNGRCVYLTGECNSPCKSGWTGNSCNIRDCKKENEDCSENETCVTVDLNFATVDICRCSPGFERKAFWEICRASSQQTRCSFPFTYNGQLFYSCTQKDSNSDEIGCFSENRVWITCPLYDLDNTAQNVTINIQIPTVDIPTQVISVNNWIVVQQRIDNSTDFGRNWAEYRNGFGVYNFNYWMGLEKMHQLTTSSQCKLRIEVYYPTLQQWRSAEYSSFVIDDEANKYTLHVSGFSGDADDGLLWSTDSSKMHDGMPFSTPDVDNDKDPKRHCANIFSSGWWFNACNYVDLNGHIEAPTSAHNYFEYYIGGVKTAVGMSRMMIKVLSPGWLPLPPLQPPLPLPHPNEISIG